MALLKNKYPNRDFFVLNIADVAPKDDTATMEHPLFSLATRPDMRHLTYTNGESTLEITPSSKGLPTIFDKDILIFCISQLIERQNKKEEISPYVTFTAHEFIVATNRTISDKTYDGIEDALARLVGTTFKTNIQNGDKRKTSFFHFVDQGGFVEKTTNGKIRRSNIEIKLSDFTMSAVENVEVLTLSNDYFRIRKPLERRLYEIARKHCGKKGAFTIGLAKLQQKTGSNATIYKFRFNVRKIIEDDKTPEYKFSLNARDQIIIRPRKAPKSNIADYRIPDWAEEKGRKIAIEKGWDYYALEREWQDFAKAQTAKGNPPEKIGASFVAFCKQKDNLR